MISDVGTSLFSLGFRTGAGYFSLDVTTRVDGGLYIPGDLARFVLTEQKMDGVYDLDGMGADISGFEELSLGWSGNIGKKCR